jgi:hypothetical protein
MTRDPSVIGRAKVGAEMLAEVINSFVEPISWKTLVHLPFTLRTDLGLTAHTDIHAILDLLLHRFRQCYHQSLPFKA